MVGLKKGVCLDWRISAGSFLSPLLFGWRVALILFTQASAAEEALQNRPGTDYFERNCDPAFRPVDTQDSASNNNNKFDDVDFTAKRDPDLSTGKSKRICMHNTIFDNGLKGQQWTLAMM